MSRLAVALAGAVGVYAIILGVLLAPPMQRFAIYANKFNHLFWRDVHDGEAFGFAKNQVTPFTITTPDGEILYAWSVLPTGIYARHEKAIRNDRDQNEGPVEDFTQTVAFKLLTSNDDPPPRVVVSFHGNAGDIAQGWRPDTIRSLVSVPNTYVFTIDYRGFGHSTGSPDEAGVIMDGVTLVEWIMREAKVPSERVVIMGQSLGTAVASAVALHFASPRNPLLPPPEGLRPSLDAETGYSPVTFAGVLLVAPFNSIPTLLLTYRIGGLLPILLPLRPVPFIAKLFTSKVVDTWLTAERLTAYYHALRGSTRLRSETRSLGSLQIIHATDDADIPYHQTEMICRRILGERGADEALDAAEIQAKQCIDGPHGASVLDLNREGWPRLRFELVGHGGHNKIVSQVPVAVAVIRALDDLFER